MGMSLAPMAVCMCVLVLCIRQGGKRWGTYWQKEDVKLYTILCHKEHSKLPYYGIRALVQPTPYCLHWLVAVLQAFRQWTFPVLPGNTRDWTRDFPACKKILHHWTAALKLPNGSWALESHQWCNHTECLLKRKSHWVQCHSTLGKCGQPIWATHGLGLHVALHLP